MSDCEHRGTPPKPSCVEAASVVSNEEIAPGVFEIRLRTRNIAAAVSPGQFVHILVAPDSPHILRRPFSVYASEGNTISIMYQVLGVMTRKMTQLRASDEVSVMGPLGSGWNPPKDARKVLFVTGGLGAAALAMLAVEMHASGVDTHVAMGAPTELRLVGRRHYESYGCNVHVATDDGSDGEKGFCTDVARKLIETNDFDYIATCGPEPMQRIVADVAREARVACEVSLERFMACGTGACLSCVIQTIDGQKRVCCDGPVFDATKVVW